MGFFESVLIGVSIAAIPGPIFFEIIRKTLTKGFFEAVLLSLGSFVGYTLTLSIVFFGFSIFLKQPTISIALYFVGAAILFWIGINALRLSEKEIEKKEEKHLNSNSFASGFGIAATSPIVNTFWVSLTGTYLSNYLPIEGFLNILLITAGFVVFHLSLGLAVRLSRHKIPPRYVLLISKIFGIILIVFGLTFVLNGLKLANFTI